MVAKFLKVSAKWGSKISSLIYSFILFLCFSNSLAFATEPVIASLANLLGNYERMPVPVPTEIKVSYKMLYHLSLSQTPGYIMLSGNPCGQVI